MRQLPSADYLRECFAYNKTTGMLTWKTRSRDHFRTHKGWAVWNANNAGNRAGNTTLNGYRRVLINSISFREHRVIWKLLTSVDPLETVDHKDGNPSNNKWKNLRIADHRQQKWNSKVRVDNRSGYRGVHPTGARWSARISIKGKYRHLGCFATREGAATAYEVAARKLHGEFYREAAQ